MAKNKLTPAIREALKQEIIDGTITKKAIIQRYGITTEQARIYIKKYGHPRRQGSHAKEHKILEQPPQDMNLEPIEDDKGQIEKNQEEKIMPEAEIKKDDLQDLNADDLNEKPAQIEDEPMACSNCFSQGKTTIVTQGQIVCTGCGLRLKWA